MKKNLKNIFLMLFIAAIFVAVIILHNQGKFIISGKVKTSQTILSDELQVKFKTVNSVNISWENIQVPDGTASYNVYKNNQLVTNITNITSKNYLFSSLSGSGTLYSFKVEFVDSTGVILLTKTIENVGVASTISSFSQSITYPKDTYYISSTLTIPVGVVINFEAGSVVKVSSSAKIILNGEINLLGNTEERVVLTSYNDSEFGGSGNYYWDSFQISSTGILNANYSYIKYFGDVQFTSLGSINLDNTIIKNTGSTINSTAGNINISNSTFDNSLSLTNVENVNLQNSTVKGITLNYTNLTQANNVDIQNNNITNGIDYTSNALSSPIIKNNVANLNNSVIRANLINSNRDTFLNVSGNTNLIGLKYGEIQITGLPTIGELNLPKAVYCMSCTPRIAKDLKLTLDSGSMLKLNLATYLNVEGQLILNGTSENRTVITVVDDMGISYVGNTNTFCGINVSSTGKLELNNTDIRNVGYLYMFSIYLTAPISSTGNVVLTNTNITKNTTISTFTGGSLNVNNCNLSSGIDASNLSDFSVKNTSIPFLSIKYSNTTLANNIDIQDNNIKSGIIYGGNILSNPIIKNNVANIDSSVVKVELTNANKNALMNISGNTNLIGTKYGQIYIKSMPTSGEIIFPKLVYYLGFYFNIPQSTSVTVLPGSTLKIESTKLVTINGKLNLQGTNEEKIIVTALNDMGTSTLSSSYYFGGIKVGTTGEFQCNNAIIKNIGYVNSESVGYIYSLNSLGNVKISNTIFEKLGTEELINGGNIEMLNSDIQKKMNIKNASNVDIQNNSVLDLNVAYDNLTLANNVNIKNNNIVNGIKYIPNLLSLPIIQNNTSTTNYPLGVSITNANPNVFQDVSGNNCSNIVYNSNYISGTFNNLKLSKNNIYSSDTIVIPNGKLLEIEAGAKLKLTLNSIINLSGNLVVNGTQENPVKITNITESASNYASNISISNTGTAIINNMEMKYFSSGIANYGRLYMINSSITNVATNSNAITYYSTNTDQILKYNYIGGPISVASTSPAVDATYNYWGASDGPKRYNPTTQRYEGSGTNIGTSTNILWNTYNPTFIKTDLVLDTYINDVKKTEMTHFGEVGVNGYTGNYSKSSDDLNIAIPNVDLKFTRTYNSKNNTSSGLGRGWSFGFSSRVELSPLNPNVMYAYLPNGSVDTFTKQSNGNFVSDDSRNTLTLESGKYVLTTKEQTRYMYNDSRFLYKIVDKYLNETNITVDSTGKVTKIVDYAGRTYNLTYTNDKITKVTDPLNRSVTYKYNAQGLLSEVVGLNSKSTYYEYDPNGYMTYIKEANDTNQIVTAETITYTSGDTISGGKVSSIKDSTGNTSTYTYNTTDKTTTIVDQNSRATINYYDASGYITKVVNQAGLETNIYYELTNGNNKYGEIKSKTDFTGNRVTYERDLNGNVLKQTNVDNTYKTYEYNSKNSVTKEVDESGNITNYTYAANLVTLTKKIMPNSGEVNFEYNQTGIKGLVNKKTDENSNELTYEYDSYGNVTKELDVTSGNSSTFTYNALGFLMSKQTAEGYTTTYEYDNSGNNTKVIQNNIPTINTYNYKNKLTSTTNANGKTISYEYDANQNVTKKTDEANNVTTYEYDIYNNMTKETLPNSAIYTYGYDNLDRNISKSITKDNVTTLLEEKTYSYSNGNKTTNTKTYTKNNEYTNSTKVLNYYDKVVSESVEDAIKTTTYTTNGLVLAEENEVGKRIYYTYNSIGKVATKYEEIDTGLYKVTIYSYDLVGNLTQEKTSQEKVLLNALPNLYITANYTYDSNSNLIIKTTSSGEEVKYTYDKDKNVVKEEVKIETGKYKITEYSYNFAKKVTSKKEYIEKGSLVTNSIDDTELTTLETTYEYDNMNNLTKEILPDLSTVEYTYDNLNRQLSKKIKDSTGVKEITNSQTYLFDEQKKLTSQTDANGHVTNYEYDIFGNIIKEIAPNNATTTYEYDLNGNIVKEKTPLYSNNEDSFIEYTYDKYGNVVSKTKAYLVNATDYKRITTNYEYDKTHNLLNETTAGILKSSTYNKAGKKISETDGNGNVTSYTYDANLNKVKEVNSNATVTKHFYDERNNLVKTTIDDVTDLENTYDLVNDKLSEKDSLGKILENTYDINCNLVKQKDTSENYEIKNQYTKLKKVAKTIDNAGKELNYTYDILGNETSKQEKKQDGTQVVTTSIEYDNVSNKTKETDRNGNITTYTYDVNNNLLSETNAKNQTTTYEYDLNGNKIKEIDYLANEQEFVYDKLDRVVQKIDQYDNVIERLEYDDLGRQTKSIDVNDNFVEFTYDSNDNVISKKDEEGHIETFEYDGLKNKTKYTDKNGNVTNYEYTNKNKIKKVTNALNEVTSYTYDNAGNILTQKDGKNNLTTYQYDLNGNEIKKIDQLGNIEEKTYYPNGLMATFISNNGDTFIYEYDIHGRLVKETLGQEETTYEYDNNGNKTKIGNVTKTYDELDRVLTSSENSRTVTYSYDDANKIKSITDSKGNIKTEEYDKANRLIKVTAGTDITQYEYNTNGSLKKQINPNTIVTYEYYADNKVKRLTTKDLSGNIIEESYSEYDSNNNVLKDNDKIYTYDVLNRIHTSVENTKTTTYSYDAAGNILSKGTLDGTNLTTISYLYNDKNQLLGTTKVENLVPVEEVEYTYDDNGNQLTETKGTDVTTNTYSARNELTQVEKGQDVSTYEYNAEGKRIQKTTGNETTNFVYDKDNVILELDNQNTEVATNTYGLALIQRDTIQKGYYVYNGHGDVLKVLDGNNNVLNTYKYDEFGSIEDETGNFNNPFRYAGYYYDKETKTYYLQARYYNPAIQRFISEDTYRGELEDPLSLNLYIYVANNPLMYVDPSGHFFETVLDVLGLAYDTADFVEKPSLIGVGMIAWDVASIFIPVLPGSYAISAVTRLDTIMDTAKITGSSLMAGFNISKKVDTANDILKVANRVDKVSDIGKAVSKIDTTSDVLKITNKTADISNGMKKVTKDNYRKIFLEEFPELPEGYQIHHTLPQKYNKIFSEKGINIHDIDKLKGVEPKIHFKITSEWSKWDKSLGKTPSVKEVMKFKKEIDVKYNKYWFNK